MDYRFARIAGFSPFQPTSLITILLFSLSFLTPHVNAQGIQRVVNMKSGLQHEGEAYGVPAIMEGAGAITVYGTQPTVRIDDGLRQIYVSLNSVDSVGDSQRNEVEIPIFQNPYGGQEGYGSILNVSPFNEHGHRTITVHTPPLDPVTYIQGITKVHPRYCELQVVDIIGSGPMKQWTMKIGTGTVPADVLRNVLHAQIHDGDNPAAYLKIADFFLQAERFNLAIEELRFIQNIFPDLQEQLDDNRKMIRQAYAKQVLREIRIRMENGQDQLATAFAKAFNKEGIALEVLAEFRELENAFAESQKQLDQTRTQINELIAANQNLDADQLTAVNRFKNEIETNLNQVNAPRLDGYLRFANDAAMPPEQKLSLAISGWVLGSNAAIDNLAVTQELFVVRDLVIEYLTCGDALRRSRILNQLAEFETGSPAYIDAMVKQLNPPQSPDLADYTGERPFEFTVEIPGPKIDPAPLSFRCLVQLPPEYDPYRRYPLLITLPGGRQTADQNLEMYCGGFSPNLGVRTGHAMRNGYITMAVDWRLSGQSVYGYSGREHATVLKALRGALRRFSVDSDRVFLAGHGIGGEAAYDIGLSHPEHWAGILGVSGKMDQYQDVYKDNEHVNLPVYSVVGGKDLPTIIETKKQWNNWLPSKKYQDCTVVMYDGRANELFPEEIPEMFKWMRVQRRKLPDKSGFRFECKSIRPWDCYFWFFEFDGIPAEDVIWPEAYREKNVSTRMTIEGEIKASNPNQFRLGPSSFKILNDSTLWLSPEFVDFDKLIQIKGRGSWKGFVKPSTEVILEDVRRRAERQHAYWGRVDCRNNDWQPND